MIGREDVRGFFARDDLDAVIIDCLAQWVRFGGDLPIPRGGFVSSPAFDPRSDVIPRLRVEDANAMRELYYGP